MDNQTNDKYVNEEKIDKYILIFKKLFLPIITAHWQKIGKLFR